MRRLAFLAAVLLAVSGGYFVAGKRGGAKAIRTEAAGARVTTVQNPVVYRLDAFEATPHRAAHPIRKGRPLRFAEATDVAIAPSDEGRWSAAEGMAQWNLVVETPGALNLNFGFERFVLPPSASLVFQTRDGDQLVRTLTAADNREDGQLWTPVFAGESVELVLRVAEEERDAVDLRVGSINRGFRDVALAAGRRKIGTDAPNGNCHLDVVCPAGHPGVSSMIDQYRDQIRSAGVYTLQGIDTCSGSLVNNTAQDGKAYFLTADHCGVTPGNASTMVVYWNFQNSTCRTPNTSAAGQDGDGPLNQFSMGATFRAGYTPSDFTLVEMDTALDPAWDLHYAGWSRSAATPSLAVCVHHPNTSEKRISFEMDALQSTNENGTSTNANGTHWRIIDWDFGTTEGGSSGSPIFDQDGHVVGQLTGGGAACGNNSSDWYGKFSLNWTGGGTSSTRLSDWLDPIGSNPLTLDGIDGNQVGVSISNEQVVEGDSGTVSMQFTVQLSQAAEEVIEVNYSTQDASASSASDYVPVTNATVTLAVGETTQPVTITINGDTSPEENESFLVQLSLGGSSPAYLEDSAGTGTILNDDFIAPVVTGPSVVNGSVGTPVATTVTAVNTPTSFGLSGEPAGMTIDSSGLISWIPTSSGTFPVTVTASNSAGSDDAGVSFVIAPNPLADAVEAEGFIVRTGGSVDWTRNLSSGDSINGGSRAQSGTITHDQSTWLEVEVEGPDYLGFWWKVSSEEGFDFLRWSVDGVLREAISGSVDWGYRVLVIGPGTHTVRWTYEKDVSEAAGSDRGWVDLVQLASKTARPFLMEPPVVPLAAGQPADYQFPTWEPGVQFTSAGLPAPLSIDPDGSVTGVAAGVGETDFSVTMAQDGNVITIPATVSVKAVANVGQAVEQSNLSWSSSGDGAWGTSTTSRQDGDSAKESGVPPNGRGELSTVVTGPGALSFWWSVSSEEGFDGLIFELDGEPLDSISGEVGWEQFTVDLDFGPHVLTWAYIKDDSVSSGQDTGWIDEVVLDGYAGWAAAEDLGGRSNPIFNRDGDELNQWFEDATGGSATSFDYCPSPTLVNGVMEWNIIKPAGLRDVFFDAEVSPDLETWGTAERTILQDDAAMFRARDNLGGSSEARRFMRGLAHPTR